MSIPRRPAFRRLRTRFRVGREHDAACAAARSLKHARFGWALVARLAPALDARLRERLGAYLVGAFEHLSRYFAPLASLPRATDAELRLGASDGPENWRLAAATVEEVIIPGLERYAIPASAAWRAARPHIPFAAAAGATRP